MALLPIYFHQFGDAQDHFGAKVFQPLSTDILIPHDSLLCVCVGEGWALLDVLGISSLYPLDARYDNKNISLVIVYCFLGGKQDDLI